MNETRLPVSLYTGPSGPWGQCLTPVLRWPVEANKSLIMDSPVIILYQYYNFKYQFCDCNAIYYIYFSTLSKGLKGKYLAQAFNKETWCKILSCQLSLTHLLSVLQKDGVSFSFFLSSFTKLQDFLQLCLLHCICPPCGDFKKCFSIEMHMGCMGHMIKYYPYPYKVVILSLG